MANHKSALKRIRSDETKKSLNKLQHKTTRNAIKKLKDAKSKKRKRIALNQQLKREGRTPNQIARVKKKRARKGIEEKKPWERRY